MSNNPATGLPSVVHLGGLQVGREIRGDNYFVRDPDGMPSSYTEYFWQWQRLDNDGLTWLNIDGATSQYYTLGGEDVAQRLRVQMSFYDNLGAYETVISNPTDPITNPNFADTEAQVTFVPHSSVTEGDTVVLEYSVADVDGEIIFTDIQWMISTDGGVGVTYSGSGAWNESSFTVPNGIGYAGEQLRVSVNTWDASGGFSETS